MVEILMARILRAGTCVHKPYKFISFTVDGIPVKLPESVAAPLNVWQQAIDEELVSTHLGVAHNDATFEGAQKAIHELICWHIDVATNPATNGGQRLTDAKPIELPEPDSYLFQHEDTGQTMFVDAQQVEWGFEANNPRLHKVSGVYTEQQVRELLEAQGVKL
jgi:hypothetical protein